MSDYWVPVVGQHVRLRLPITGTLGPLAGRLTHPRKYRVVSVGSDSEGRPTACLDYLDADGIYTNWLVPLSPLEQLAEAADGNHDLPPG